MASNKSLEEDIEWGDTVFIIKEAPQKYNPGMIGSVCGLRIIGEQSVAEEFQASIGSFLILVELNNGTSFEVPKFYLKKVV